MEQEKELPDFIETYMKMGYPYLTAKLLNDFWRSLGLTTVRMKSMELKLSQPGDRK